MALPGALQQFIRIGQICATDEAKLHTAFAKDDRADHVSVAGAEPVTYNPGRCIHHFKEVRYGRNNRLTRRQGNIPHVSGIRLEEFIEFNICVWYMPFLFRNKDLFHL